MQSIPYLGPLTVSVPGAVDGWHELHERYGRLPMTELLQPSIDYAEQGFPVTEFIADLWQENIESRKDFPGIKEVFMPGGDAPKTGDVFKNPNLANTYRMIAEGGRAIFSACWWLPMLRLNNQKLLFQWWGRNLLKEESKRCGSGSPGGIFFRPTYPIECLLRLL